MEPNQDIVYFTAMNHSENGDTDSLLADESLSPFSSDSPLTMSGISELTILSDEDMIEYQEDIISDDLYVEITADIISNFQRCQICDIYSRDILYYPCRHLICIHCDERCIECPFCKRDIKYSQTVQLHLETCMVCNQNTVTLMIKPCMHICTCESCIDDLFYCPICSNPILETLKVFV